MGTDMLVTLLRHLTDNSIHMSMDKFAQATCRHVYSILAVIVENYNLNEFLVCHLAFSPYQEAGSWTILNHLGRSLGAEHLLAVILCHNMRLVQLVHDDTIRRVVRIFVQECRHDKMVLEFLTSLCSCNGQQVRKNQVSCLRHATTTCR